MECPKCGYTHYTKVLDSRPYSLGRIWRKRNCLRCGERFHTLEISKKRLSEPPELKNLIADIEGLEKEHAMATERIERIRRELNRLIGVD